MVDTTVVFESGAHDNFGAGFISLSIVTQVNLSVEDNVAARSVAFVVLFRFFALAFLI